MPLTEAAEKIRAAGAVAIVLPDAAELIAAGTAATLARALAAPDKTVHVFGPMGLPFGMRIDTEPLREFIVSFDTAHSPVRELRYERDQNRLNVILAPSDGRISRDDVEFRTGSLRYDLAIAVGVASPEAAQSALRRAPELFMEKPVVNLGADSQAQRFGEWNLIADASRGEYLPIVAWRLLSVLNALPQGSADASPLLAALIEATGHLRMPGTPAEALRIAADLLDRGAQVLPELAPGPERLRAAQLAARALARSRFDPARDITWSVLTPDDFQATGGEPRGLDTMRPELQRMLPYAGRIILLWQDPQSRRVHADLLLAGAPLEQAAGRAVLPAETYASFAEAEAAIVGLLGRNDGIQ
ncbi:hypothetical protein C4552_01850 [Candidatus Parcubacteria bacterium]|nr:MAG: hypothetical protein C4552_01850 [Candidatus Parcubacteria bacterium]